MPPASAARSGGLAGGDVAVNDTWRLGLFAGYSHDRFANDDRASSGASDNYHLGLYGGGQWGSFGLSGGAAYSFSRIETARLVAFPGFADSLMARYDAGTAQIFGGAGYRIDTAAASFEPFANLAYVSARSDGFAERGGAALLQLQHPLPGADALHARSLFRALLPISPRRPVSPTIQPAQS